MVLITLASQFSNSQNVRLCFKRLGGGSKLFGIYSKRAGSTVTSQQDPCRDGHHFKLDVGCKVALINGGISGIGLATAGQLLCAGARNVVITGPDSCLGKASASALNNAHGVGKAMFVACDVNCMSQFEAAFRKTYDTYKRIDIVVNSATICDGSRWEREIVTNIIGTIRGTLLACRYVGKEGLGKGGVVINIAGVFGLDALPPAPTLCASQHAIVGLSRSFGNIIHTKKSGLRVVCLCPGLTHTDFFKGISTKGMSDSLGQELQNVLNRTSKQKPEACGQAVLHLIRYGENGSVWVCERSKLFALQIPDRKHYSNVIAQYF